jgi:hypothetical protein
MINLTPFLKSRYTVITYHKIQTFSVVQDSTYNKTCNRLLTGWEYLLYMHYFNVRFCYCYLHYICVPCRKGAYVCVAFQVYATG